MTTISNTTSTASTSASTSTSSSGSLEGTTDEFLEIFIAQLQHQDPTAPMDSTDMVSSIAQLNQVTATEEMNTSLAEISSQLEGLSSVDLTSLVDKSVSYSASSYINSGEVVTGSTLAGQEAVSIQVKNASGQVVKEADVANGEFAIDGSDLSLERYYISALDENGEELGGVSLDGEVASVNIVESTIELENGDNIAYDSVTKVQSGE